MDLQQITNKKSFIKYLKKYDKENIQKYLLLIDDLQIQCTHDLFKLSIYIFERMKDKNIKNKFNYFKNSLYSNIKKLNEIQININSLKSKEEKPYWFGKEIEKRQATKEEIEEMEKILNEFK